MLAKREKRERKVRRMNRVPHPTLPIKAVMFFSFFISVSLCYRAPRHFPRMQTEQFTFEGGYVTPEAIQERASLEDRSYFLLVNDVHADLWFKAGSDPNQRCINGTGTAGVFGEHVCDTPFHALDAALQATAKAFPDPDFLLYLGDAPPHNLDPHGYMDLNDMDVIDSIDRVIGSLSAAYPETVPVFPILGNHDTYPEECLPLSGKARTDWLGRVGDVYERCSGMTAQSVATFKEYGWYTEPINDAATLVVMNTVYYDMMNFYVMFEGCSDRTAPDQWTWLEDQLQTAEAEGKKVILALHRPVGYDAIQILSDFCVDASRTLEDILVRYSHVVPVSLAGHTHRDEWRVIRDPATDAPAHTIIVAPGATGYTVTNPGLRLVEWAPSTGEILGWTQLYWNIDLSNQYDYLDLRVGYRTVEEYGARNINATVMDGINQRLVADDSAFSTFYGHLYVENIDPTSWSRTDRALALCAIQYVNEPEYNQCLIDLDTNHMHV
ncbi:hypothetical protein KIPB_008714 [Kipferlia bialata]|uniref:Calcineurin-like phosphoesterase domain-containing protein n=1 Tax=Kipferlia bialata TaxID=797122 RepID=A0A9K3D0F2_9EUKA|nr:hypothetical protein KIPB_008714 [Kipferlia bialata]|eukprot:g8714.t1